MLPVFKNMKIYYAYTDEFDDSFYKNALIVLPEEKASDIAKIKNEKPNKETLLAWTLLRYAMKEDGKAIFDVDFSKNGKPYLKNCPLFFNLTHSEGLVCCAVCQSEVGIDAEMPKPCRKNVIKRVLCENEINSMTDEENDFIKLWTIKESFLKHSGKGISAGLSNLDFSSVFKLEEFDAYGLHFKTAVIDKHKFCVCSKEKKYEFIRIFADTLSRHLT